jgi:ABC-type transporter Mla subunit MlaD
LQPNGYGYIVSTTPPALDIQKIINDVLALLRNVDPVGEGVKLADQGRRTVEALIVALENVGATMDNLNQAAARVNRLLDDVEDPIRRIAGMADQAGSLINFLPSLAGKAVANLTAKPDTAAPNPASTTSPTGTPTTPAS